MKKMQPDYITVNLKYLRRCFGYTQTHLAQKLHLSRSSYGALENGSCAPRADLLSALSCVYQVSIDTILEENRDKFIRKTCILKEACDADSRIFELLGVCTALSPFSLGRLFETAEIIFCKG